MRVDLVPVKPDCGGSAEPITSSCSLAHSSVPTSPLWPGYKWFWNTSLVERPSVSPPRISAPRSRSFCSLGNP